MGLIKRIHHVEIMTKSLDSVCKYLMKGFGFRLISKGKENILQSGSAIFIVKEFANNCLHQIDTVFDVALEVTNLQEIIARAKSNNDRIIQHQTRISDKFGFVDIAQLGSCVGNVVHTIIDKHDYPGKFLPGYIEIEQDKSTFSEFVRSFDHITYVVHKSCSSSVLKWYSTLFDMKKFFINKNDLLDEGFVLHHKNNGMRLAAFDYWKCDENFLSNHSESCKFVVAEELTENGKNQINEFLMDHKGPGIQHIGLSVSDIIHATEISINNGVTFLKPPTGYYEIIKRNPKIQTLEWCMDKFEKYGILVDAETEFSCSENTNGKNFLYQVFTNPIFDRHTFFLELIQRQGATGFGSGNIKALWDAVDLSQESIGTTN